MCHTSQVFSTCQVHRLVTAEEVAYKLLSVARRRKVDIIKTRSQRLMKLTKGNSDSNLSFSQVL